MNGYGAVNVTVIAVVKVTVLLSDIADWPKVNSVYQKCMYLAPICFHHYSSSRVTIFWYSDATDH